MPAPRPLFLANKPIIIDQSWSISDKFSGRIIATVSLADRAMIEQAILAATQAAEPMRKLPAHRRQSILQQIGEQLTRLAASLARR